MSELKSQAGKSGFSPDPDFARRLLLDRTLLQQEIERTQQAAYAEASTDQTVGELGSGISVVIPAYQAASTLQRTLDSLQQQTLDHHFIEVVVIVNGDDDGSIEIGEAFARNNPTIDTKIYHHAQASAGKARNIGIRLASRDYLTLLDADDELEPAFLETAFALADPQTVVLNNIANIDDEGQRDNTTSLSVRIAEVAGSRFPIVAHPWVLSFNACKTFPTAIARRFVYDADLRSGEDILFFAHLLTVEDLTVSVVQQQTDTYYLRHLTESSISRQPASYDFNVTQRIAVIAALNQIKLNDTAAQKALEQLQRAQASFALRYLEDHPDAADDVELELARQGVLNFPWELINKKQARDLAFSYCFPPFSDTSANVASKAIVERRKVVDVVSNDLTGIRKIDPENLAAVRRWVGEHIIVKASPSFSGWEPISDFANKAVQEAEQLHAVNGGYRTLYSRALWVGSHVAAAMFILRHPEVKWSAEFSDPLRYDASGQPRKAPFKSNRISERLQRAISAAGFRDIEINSIFDLVEAATFVLAHELIFTNKNQMEYMLLDYSDEMKALVRSKARIRHHPQPSEVSYLISESTYRLAKGVVNIGFFGSFYENRGLTEVLVAIANLPMEARRKLRLHIFCNKVPETSDLVKQLGVAANVYVNSYLGYFTFLNLTTKFDVLLVNDVVRDASMPINPFLPSKYSDYLGAGAKIWGLVDDGSPLSTLPLDYRSKAGHGPDIRTTLMEIATLTPKSPL